MRSLSALVFCVGLVAALPSSPVLAAGQGVVAIVDDTPITDMDINQRIALMKMFGGESADASRKGALRSLIDEEVKIQEITKFKLAPTDAEINKQIDRMAKGLQTDRSGLFAKLGKQGISEASFRRYVTALIGFNRIISSKYQNQLNVNDADVDRKFSEIKTEYAQTLNKIRNDPRMRPVTVFELREITLPVEEDDPNLLQSRAIEASELAKRIKGCGNLRGAAEGIFNVKIGKPIEADASKLPKELRAALEKMGTGRALGPMRAKSGIQLLAFCNSRKVSPEMPKLVEPTRQQVEGILRNELYDKFEQDYLKTARSSIYVEYRDQ
jgi:peptidyl-prolyl cis-trans isomerase SurA